MNYYLIICGILDFMSKLSNLTISGLFPICYNYTYFTYFKANMEVVWYAMFKEVAENVGTRKNFKYCINIR